MAATVVMGVVVAARYPEETVACMAGAPLVVDRAEAGCKPTLE